jgi:hypothetical protein
MQASSDDPYLEAWVLPSTKAVSQTEREQALKAGERLGVATFVFDWTPPTSGAEPMPASESSVDMIVALLLCTTAWHPRCQQRQDEPN